LNSGESRLVTCGRIDEIVRQAGRLIRSRITVELCPTSVMMQNHVEHQIVRLSWLKPIVPKVTRELMRKLRVRVHRDRQTGLTSRRRLNDHAQALVDHRRPKVLLAVAALGASVGILFERRQVRQRVVKPDQWK
jgi:hypothetical protein